MLRQCSFLAESTILSDGIIMFRSNASSFETWEISQFWQCRHLKLHPRVAMEKVRLPGRKWYKGFFSMGSTFCAAAAPYIREYRTPLLFSRTPQIPRLPSAIRHRWRHRLQRTLPSSFNSQNNAFFTGIVRLSIKACHQNPAHKRYHRFVLKQTALTPGYCFHKEGSLLSQACP